MTGYYMAVAALALLTLAGIALSLAVGARLQRLEKLLQEVGVPASPPPPIAVSPPTAEPPHTLPPEGEPDKFSAALMGGEMNLRLAQERENREPPEKYRYIKGLAEQGMSAEEIARVLHLSPGEVQQLLTLAQLGRGDA